MKVVNKQKGFSLVEVILASALFGIIVMAILGGISYAQQSVALAGMRSRAVMIAEEGLEALQSIRDSDYTLLTSGTYGISKDSGSWELISSPDTVGEYIRSVNIDVIDVFLRDITVSVSWKQGGVSKDIELFTTLTNWTDVGRLDWVSPSISNYIDIEGGNSGTKIQANNGYVYMVRENGDPDFVVIDVRDVANPVLVDIQSIDGNPTNIAIGGNYAYVTSSSNTQELQIIDISDPENTSIVASYDAFGSQDANSVEVNGDYLAMVSSYYYYFSGFRILDISNPLNPTNSSTTILWANGVDVVVLEDYAFVATESNSRELQVVRLDNPSFLWADASYDTPGNGNPLAISGYGNTIILGHSDDNVYIFDVSNPTSPILKTTYDVGGNVNDISMGYDNTYAFIVSSASTQEFLVLDVEDLDNISLVGSLDLSSVANGIAYDATSNRAFIAGTGIDEEFMILAPQ